MKGEGRGSGRALDLKLGWFHRYPARFAPEALGDMLAGTADRLGHYPGRLLDPFMGTGSTLAAARQLGITAFGLERFPLGVLIARLRLDPPADLDQAVSWADDLARIEVPLWVEPLAPLKDWMGDENARLVTAYIWALRRFEDRRLRRFLEVAVSSALRASSRWLAGSIKAQVDPDRQPRPLPQQVRRTARAIAKDCRLEAIEASTAARAGTGDARMLPFPDSVFDAIVTSPPYWETYDYISTQRLTYLAFGWPVAIEDQVGRMRGIIPDGVGFAAPPSLTTWYSAYGAERMQAGRSLREYVQRMRQHLHEAHRVLRPDGVATYALANSKRAGKEFDLVGAFVELADEAGFRSIEVIRRTISNRRILPAGRNIETGRFGSGSTPGIDERLIYARKPGAS